MLKNEYKSSGKEHSSTFSSGSLPDIFYGHPKVHKKVVKNNLKFWPILSAVKIPMYFLANYLNPILSPLTTYECTAKNPFYFAKEVVSYDHSNKLLRTVSTTYSPTISTVTQ